MATFSWSDWRVSGEKKSEGGAAAPRSGAPAWRRRGSVVGPTHQWEREEGERRLGRLFGSHICNVNGNR